MEGLLVGGIVLLALVYTLRHFAAGKKGCKCGCACSGGATAKTCGTSRCK